MPHLSGFSPTLHQAMVAQAVLVRGAHDRDDMQPAEKLLAVLRPCNAEIALALGKAEGDTVIHLRTLRRVNGVPACVINHYFADLRGWPVLQQFNNASLHDVMRQELGLELNRKQTRITARRAHARESQLLEVALHAPLLCVRTLNSNQHGELAEYSVSLAPADMIELTLEH